MPPDTPQPRHTTLKPLRKGTLLALALGLAALTYGLAPFDATVRKGLALLVFIGTLWLTEALDLAVTALLVPLGALVLGIPGLTTTSVLEPFANPIVFLFLGGFALASALHAQQLDRKLAVALLSLSKGHLTWAAALLFCGTALLSMGISNTATAAMVLPLTLGLLRSLGDRPHPGTRAFLLLGVAYAANIGGIGTLVGSPPNAIAAKAAGISYAEWLRIGLPLVGLLLPLMFLTLLWVLRPALRQRFAPATDDTPWTPSMVLALVVFGLTALGWVWGTTPLLAMGVQSPDTFVALAAAVAVVALGLTSWQQVVANTDWGVLLLFGGGLALGHVLDRSGASLALGTAVSTALQDTSPWGVLLAVATFMVLLTEFASNTAAAALMVPVFGAVATQMGLAPDTLIVVVALAASFGFALPVATPPNAMVFATGQVSQRRMLRAGMALNVVCVAVLTAWGVVQRP